MSGRLLTGISIALIGLTWACQAGSQGMALKPGSDGATASIRMATPSEAIAGSDQGPRQETTLAQAFRLHPKHEEVSLILVSRESTGLEGKIYEDLVRRNFRMTTGPDEGLDTAGETCYPNCLYALREQAGAIAVEGWLPVIEHEYRHIVQARHNQNLAHDFRDQNGPFTPYAAFSEACADYGLDVAPVYQAQFRIDRVKRVLGATADQVIDRACTGDRGAYELVRSAYDRAVGVPGSFSSLFPPYD